MLFKAYTVYFRVGSSRFMIESLIAFTVREIFSKFSLYAHGATTDMAARRLARPLFPFGESNNVGSFRWAKATHTVVLSITFPRIDNELSRRSETSLRVPYDRTETVPMLSLLRNVEIKPSRFLVVLVDLSIATSRVMMARKAAVTARSRAEASFEMPLGLTSEFKLLIIEMRHGIAVSRSDKS